jgi:N-acetylglutamate synthase/N-acetylornithine aminotransferase
VQEAMKEREVDMRLYYAASEEKSEIYFSDLGPEYVRLNAEYS